MPLKGRAKLKLGSVPESEANKFKKMYRYFPNFAVLES